MPEEINYLTDFYLEIRSILSRNKYSNALPDTFLEQGKNIACRLISQYKPVINQTANIEIESNSTSVDLPGKFFRATIGDLYKLKYNQELYHSAKANYLDIYSKLTYGVENIRQFDGNGRQYASYAIRNAIYNNPYYKVNLSSSLDSSFSIELANNGKKGFCLLFDDGQEITARTHKLKYDAIHEITSEKDTITDDIRGEFLDLCRYHIYIEAGIYYAEQSKKDQSLMEQAKYFQGLAKEYKASLTGLINYGVAD